MNGLPEPARDVLAHEIAARLSMLSPRDVHFRDVVAAQALCSLLAGGYLGIHRQSDPDEHERLARCALSLADALLCEIGRRPNLPGLTG